MSETIYINVDVESMAKLLNLPNRDLDFSDVEVDCKLRRSYYATPTSFKKGHNKGIKLSEDRKKKLHGGWRKWQDEWYELNPNYKDTWKKYEKKGNANTIAAAKRTAAKNNATILTCPHCGKEGNLGNMKRWHFDNCGKKRSIVKDKYGRFRSLQEK